VVQPALDKISNPSLTQNQVNAVGSFVFNVGQTQFSKSVLPSLNAGNTAGAADHMGRFVKRRDKGGNLVTDNGLVNRRTAELELYNAVQ
jgi:lysozyme